jgi:hypothetical protein
MKKVLSITFIIALLLMIFPSGAQAAYAARLVAGQNQIVGWVFVDNDASALTITFETRYDLGFCLNETNLHVADSLAGIPQTSSGNPKVGQFDYQGTHSCVGQVTYIVPLDGWTPGTQLFIAAHAVVGNWNTNQWPDYEETGWGVECGDITNHPFPGGSWANYFLYTVK